MKWLNRLRIGAAVLTAIHRIADMAEAGKMDPAKVEAEVTPALQAAGVEVDPVLLGRIVNVAVMFWSQGRTGS